MARKRASPFRCAEEKSIVDSPWTMADFSQDKLSQSKIAVMPPKVDLGMTELFDHTINYFTIIISNH
jgi:hypothetical protein